MPSPAAVFGRLPENLRQALWDEIEAETELGLAWREKVRRFASFHGRHLRNVAGSRFGLDRDSQLKWLVEVLIRPDPSTGEVDPAALNGALFAADALKSGTLTARVHREVEALRARLLKIETANVAAPILGEPFAPTTRIWKREAALCDPVVIISPMQKSLYTLSLMELCRRYRVPMAGIILRRFDLHRFQQEFRRDGARLFRKIWRKLVLRADENKEPGTVSLKAVFELLDPGFSDVQDFALELGVPVYKVSTLDNPPSSLDPQVARTALFTGGGMIRKPMLDQFSNGILNVHLGTLPQYKGMDVVQATILDGCFDKVGLTSHLMTPSLDEGPVISTFTNSSEMYASLGALRNEMSALLPLMSFDACLGLASGRYQPVRQSQSGRQHYVVHRALNQVIDDVLARRHIRGGEPSPIETAVKRLLIENM